MLEQFVDIMKYFDTEVQSSINDEKKQKLLLEMFLVECKFNLDILDVIDYSKKQNDKDDFSEIISLLSFQGLLSVLKYEKSSSSFLTNKLTAIFNKHSSKNEDLQRYKDDEEKLMALYKRIIVLKALASISKNNDSIKKINFKTRLKNLKRILLIIIKG